MKINYVKGDATDPKGDGMKLICHVCNDIGGWGRGFVLALSKKWKEPEQSYKAWFNSKHSSFKLGHIQTVKVEPYTYVVNMIGQHDIRTIDNVPPVRYDAIRKCLKAVYDISTGRHITVHAPKFGAGLSGGDWNIIEKIIQEELCDKGIQVTIYEL